MQLIENNEMTTFITPMYRSYRKTQNSPIQVLEKNSVQATCFPDAGSDMRLSFDEATVVMAVGMNDATAFIVRYTRVHTCQQWTYNTVYFCLPNN